MGVIDLNISRIRAYNRLNGRSKRMKKLMAKKPDPKADEQPTTERKKSPHHYMNRGLKKASEEGEVESFIRILEEVSIEQELQPDVVLRQRDFEGNTCLHIAAKHGRHELIGLLTSHYEYEELFRMTNDEGDTALHIAAKEGHLSVTNLITRHSEECFNYPVGEQNGKGNMPLHEALLHDHPHLVDLLLHRGAPMSFYVNNQGKSAVYLSVEAGNVKAFSAMLDDECWRSSYYEGNIEVELMKGRSLLHAAVSRKDKVMLQQILGKGLHMLLHVKDDNGQSPIEFASSIGFEEGENILRTELSKDTIDTDDVCVNLQVLEGNPDHDLYSFLEDEKDDEGVKKSPDWEGRHERMRKLLRNVMLHEPQPVSHHCMDLGLYVTAKNGDVDEFISSLEQYYVEKNLALPTIFSQLTPLTNTFLHVASRYGAKHLSWLIIQYFPSLLIREDIHGNTALHLAAREGNLGVVKILVAFINKKLQGEFPVNINDATCMKEGMELVMENDDGRTPLQLALFNNQKAVVDLLVKKNVEAAYHVNKNGTSSIYIATLHGETEQLKHIFNTLSRYIDQKILDDQLTKGKSLLLAAIWSQKMEILEELARQKPVLFNVKDEHAQKLVHFAELLGFHEGANYLRSEFKLEIVLDGTASSVIPKFPHNSYSLDAYSLALIEMDDQKIENIRQLMHQTGRDERMRKLLCNSSLQNMPKKNPHEQFMDMKLYEAAKKGDVDGFIGALEKFMETNNSSLHTISKQKTHIKNIFLHVAASRGNEELTSFIVFYFRSLLKETNNKGNTANHEAARAGHLGVLDILLRFNKYHEQLDSYKKDDIIKFRSVRDTRLLYNLVGNTSLVEAFVNNQRKVIEYLIKSSVEEAYHVNKEGKSGLYLAVEAGMVDHVKTILSNITSEANAKVICELTNGKSLINAAIRRRCIVMLQEISTNIPAQIHVIDEDGQTPLTYEVSTGFLEGINYLIDAFKLDTSQMDSGGFYPVHIASEKGHVHILQKLMQVVPDAGAFKNRERQNILHVAAMYGKDNVVRFILQTQDMEFLINEIDHNGNTPLHLATVNWHPKVVSSLTWDHRVNLTLVNNDGLTALDAAEECMEALTSFQQRLTWSALMSAGTPRAGNKNRISSKKLNLSGKDDRNNMNPSKERVNTLLLVATLVVTVTFAAGFTMPGGYNNTEPKEGQATLLRKLMLQIFVICDTIALYSSIMVVVTLIWAQLGDPTLVLHALRCAIPLLAVSLTAMSVAFMVGVSLVVRSLTWLSDFILIFGILALASFLTLFIPLCFSGSSTSPVSRYITYYAFHLLYLATKSSDDGHNKEQ